MTADSLSKHVNTPAIFDFYTYDSAIGFLFLIHRSRLSIEPTVQHFADYICKLHIERVFEHPPLLPASPTYLSMFRSQLLRQASRAIRASPAPIASRTLPALSCQRSIHSTAPLLDAKKDEEEHEGSFARTDSSVQVEYPEEADLPSSVPVGGRGGMHFRRTLASFSLEGRVGVVTGGARGLGLVMSQAMVISGADIAIVDLNSMNPPMFVEAITDRQQRRRQRSPPSNW